VRAALDDASLVEHEDHVGRAHRRQPMGDHDRRPTGEPDGQRVLDERLVLGVEV
jgi:hypothetical protein